MFKKFLIFTAVIIIGLLPTIIWARPLDQITNWYIKDFHSEIVVNKDSSLLVTEEIVADCGDLPNKHGIFRVLPTKINLKDEKILTPIELVSITDFAGQPLKYQTIRNSGTITWKIGDPNITVKDENEYKIIYKVKNAVRFQDEFEEFYWNLNGNFWDIETDNFSADISFPAEVNKDNTNVEYYAGVYGMNYSDLAIWQWNGDILHIESQKLLMPDEGITVSVALPKNVFTAYQVTANDKWPGWPWLFLPFLIFILCFSFWKKYGRDPNLHKTVIAEYEVPDNLTPLQMGTLIGLSNFKKEYIAGAIVKFACDGIIKIEETDNKILAFLAKDYKLTLIDEKKSQALIAGEKVLLDAIFSGKKEVLLSDVKKTFYKDFPQVRTETRKWLEDNGYLEKGRYLMKYFMFGVGIFVLLLFSNFIFSALYASGFSILSLIAMILSAVIFLVFSFLMNKRTLKGAETEWKIKGFKLFMETVEKYRVQFYEKENIFEAILPYAIALGLTKKWIKAMRNIYGEEKFLHLAPVWFISSSGGFDVDSFSSALNSMSSAISHSTSSSSGQGGGGFSGGGGGGGGGGGW